ncbi:MAG: hypothetical protein RL748_254, partial [Pseudomonadota bacterium]
MSTPPEKDPGDTERALSEKEIRAFLIMIRVMPFLFLFLLAHSIYGIVVDVREWHRNEAQTRLAQQRHPKLKAQYAAFEQCLGTWYVSPPSHTKWLKCDMKQLRFAMRQGLGEDYVRYMADRDSQLEANRVDIYRLPLP